MLVTLGSRMDDAGGRPSGFDYMRLLLSIAVVVSHSFNTAEGARAFEAEWDSLARAGLRAILPMFFALSGFLVAGSMQRSRTLVKFLGLRLIRIYPALTVEVILSAFILGPLVTSRSLGSYFTDPLFARYLVNVTGHISFFLPGVFESNPVPRVVNGQLWTVPFELACYIVLGGLIAVGAKKWRGVVPAAAAALLAAWTLWEAYKTGWVLHEYYRALGGPQLVASFLLGVSIYSYRAHLPHSRTLGILAAATSFVLLGFVPFGSYIAIVPVAYLTAYIGTLNPRRVGWIRGADYSYGVFLYGFVIQQAAMYALPAARTWWINVLICVPLSLVFAALSWHAVEKPALRLRVVVDWLERKYIVLRGRAGLPLREVTAPLGHPVAGA